jgi:hypothetical protein
MRILVIGLALLTAGVALYIAVTRATGRAIDSSMRGLSQVAHEVVDSVKLDTERTNARSPILWRGDTIGRLVAVGRIQYGPRPDRSTLLYRGLLTSHPPAYQPDSLAAIDSTDDARFAHELRLVPLHSLDTTRRHLGHLQFEATNEGIPVMATVAAPQSTSDSATISAIRDAYAQIERGLPSYRRVRHDIFGFSLEGGYLDAWFDGPHLEKLDARYYRETGRDQEAYYFVGDTLVFVFAADENYDRPLTGHVVHRDENRFHFHDQRLIRRTGAGAQDLASDVQQRARLLTACANAAPSDSAACTAPN